MLLQDEDDKFSPLQSDLSALPSFVVHKRALHPGATLMPTGMNNQFSPPSIPDPNTNSSAVGINYISSTSNLDPKIALTRIIRDQKMIKNNNRGQVTGREDDKRMDVETTGKVSSVMLCCC